MTIHHPLDFVLLLLGALAFLVAVFTDIPVRHVNLIALGLLLWVLVPLLALAGVR